MLTCSSLSGSSLFQEGMEVERFEVGFISNFKHLKERVVIKAIWQSSLHRERQAIPEGDSPHLPQALFLGCGESCSGVTPLTGGGAQANGWCERCSLEAAKVRWTQSLPCSSISIFPVPAVVSSAPRRNDKEQLIWDEKFSWFAELGSFIIIMKVTGSKPCWAASSLMLCYTQRKVDEQ